MPQLNLDIDALRTLVAAFQLGGFNRAAEQVGRSQSAISQQIRKFEERLGRPLFRKNGRGLALTEAGETVLAYARRILELNDEAVAAVRGAELGGTVRFGMPGDFAETWLPAVLGRFKRAYPTVRVEATVDRNSALAEKLERGRLELALMLGLEARANSEVLAHLPMVWIGGADILRKSDEPLPLAVFEAPCFFRAAAIAALDGAGRPWRVAFTSPSLAGLWAALNAGLGITVRTAIGAPGNLVPVGERLGLPSLPFVKLCLSGAGRPLTPAAARLRGILLETLPRQLANPSAPTRAQPPLRAGRVAAAGPGQSPRTSPRRKSRRSDRD
jgi:DNA-binding transcriptional LysR family regulator